MNDQEIRIAIAEKCGWREIDPSRNAGFCPTEPRGFQTLPSYELDLNACHEFEGTLTDVQRIEYVKHIWHTNPVHVVTGYKWNQGALSQEIWWTLTHATARQRCEAFLRVHGLWKEA